MGAASGRLTEAKIKSYVSAGKPIQHNDGGGLYLRLRRSTKQGVATVGRPEWLFRYTLNKKSTWKSIGRYPQMSLADARAEAVRLLGLKDAGVSPVSRAAEREAEAPYLVDDLVSEWVERQVKRDRFDWDRVDAQLRRYAMPILSGMPVQDVHRLDIDRVLKAVMAAGYPTVANDVLRHLKRMFRWARKRGRCEDNPAADFDLDDAGGKEGHRKRYLEESELEALFEAMKHSANLGTDNAMAFKILLATCVRKGDLVRARWEHIDFEKCTWYLPDRPTKKGGDDNKKAGPLMVPLAPPVAEWFENLKVMAGTSVWVLPARRIVASGKNRFPHVSPDTLNLALSRVSGELAKFTVHDLRRTARTHLARLGVNEAIAERCLNHKPRGIKGVYDRWEYFDERKAALALWAEHLVKMGA